MSRIVRTLALLVSIGILGILGTSTAQASRGIRIDRTLITANGLLTMNNDIVCTVSLTVTMSTLIAKIVGTQGGSVIAPSTITACNGRLGVTGGTVLVPIRIDYAGFTGTLPNITGILVTAPNAGFELNSTLAGRCLYGGNMTGITFNRNTASGTVPTATFASNVLPRVAGGVLCPSGGTVRGVLNVLGTLPIATLLS